MDRRIILSLLLLCAPCVSAMAQCSSADLKPQWDADKTHFHCVDPKNPAASVKDGDVQVTGDKQQCTSARDNLQAACPAGNEGKACRNEAKSIFNMCKRSKSDSAGTVAGSTGPKTDASLCMTTFQQQQQACAAHKAPPPVPGQMTPPDTCLQDAIAAQSKCLANSH